MKLHTSNGFSFFYDTSIKLWTLYPVNVSGERIEHDNLGNPIECQYFNNRTEVNKFLNNNKK